MRISILYALIFIAYLPSINGQSIVSTISGKSGILAGASNSFAGINYDNASDKFGFNYRATNQYKSPPSDTSSYPDF